MQSFSTLSKRRVLKRWEVSLYARSREKPFWTRNLFGFLIPRSSNILFKFVYSIVLLI